MEPDHEPSNTRVDARGSAREQNLVSTGYVVAFVAVSLAGLLQALGKSPAELPRSELGLLTLLTSAYALLGTLGLSLAERRGPRATALVLTFLGALGAAATLLSKGYAAMLLLALISAGVLFLSLRLSLLVSAAAALVALCAFAARDSLWSALLQAELAFGSGIAFVFVFSQSALSERRGRREIERLAHDLSAANAALAARAEQAEELATARERNRIAREIHDGLGHYLTVVHVQLEAALALLSAQPEQARAAIRKAQQLTHQGLNEVRRSVALLRHASLPPAPLIESLGTLALESGHAGVPAALRIEGTPRRMPEPVESTLYRAAQEALTNMHRHAHASQVEIAVIFSDSRVSLQVADDGVGSDAPQPGFGLIGLRERAELIGGQISIESRSRHGFRLSLTVPA